MAPTTSILELVGQTAAARQPVRMPVRSRREISPARRWRRWPSRWLVGLAVLLTGIGLFPHDSWGQAESSPNRPTTRDAEGIDGDRAAPPLKEQQPRLIYVPDASGRPAPMLNVPLEAIEQWLDGNPADGPWQRPPRFQITALEVRGEARRQNAEFEVNVRFAVTQAATGDGSVWTSIPLRFHDAALVLPPEHTGEGDFYLVFDATEGYQGWLRHQSAGEHQLRLKFSLPLNFVAESTQLRFFPPLANQSDFSLTLPGTGVTANVENARNLQVTPRDNDTTLITAGDLRNQVSLNWRQGGMIGEQQPTYLDVRGDIRVTIDGPGAFRSSLTLDLQSYGRPIQQFSLRLPPSTKIVSGNNPGYRLSEVETTSSDDGALPRTTVQVKLENPAPQARLQLATQTTERADAGSAINVANFEVIGAVRQSGRVTLLSSEEWQVYWDHDASVRRVQNTDSFEGPAERRPLASFRYFRQPCRLDVEIKSQGTRVIVEPQYRLRLNQDRLTLDAQLDYKIQGARASFLPLTLNGWALDDVGPTGTVENDNFETVGNQPVQLRLTKPTSGELTLNLALHRPFSGSEGTLRFPLPWPGAGTVLPGVLLVRTADAMQVNYRTPEMPGFLQDPLLAATPLTTSQNGPERVSAAFRLISDGPIGEVAMDYEVRSQEVRVRSDATLELTVDAAQVNQRLTYRVAYEPATRVILDLPRELLERFANPRFRESVELRLDGEPLEMDWSQAINESLSIRESIVPVVIALDEAKLGTFELEFNYPWALRSTSSAEYSSIPLAVPRGATMDANTVALMPIGPIRIDPPLDSAWTRDDSIVGSNSLQAVGWTTDERPTDVKLRVSQLQEDSAEETAISATVIERAWLRTWLSDRQRMDRAVFRVATGSDWLVFQLPEGVKEVIAVVNGVEVTSRTGGGDLRVPLPTDEGPQHSIELSLRYESRPLAGAMEFTAPSLTDAVGPRLWFWQLLLPEDEHILTADPQLTSSNRWVRAGLFWRRQGTRTQKYLEYVMGASPQPQLPEGLNQYLYSSFDRISTFRVRSVQRHTLVFFASGLTLAAGLSLIYIPILRHPAALFAMSVVMLAGIWIYTDAAWIIAQAGMLGVALVFIASFLSFLLQQWVNRRSALHLAQRQVTDSRSNATSAWHEGSKPHSTITAPAQPVPSAATDSNI